MPHALERFWGGVIALWLLLLVGGCAGQAEAPPGDTGTGTHGSDGGTSDSSIARADAAPAADDAGTLHDDTDAASFHGDGATEFSPYFPAWTFGAKGYAYTSLVNLKQLSGVDDVTLAFVLARPDAGCVSDLATDGIADNLADVQAFTAAGGHTKISFGGADGLYLQDPGACAGATELAAAIGSVVDATGITDLDFDVEQPFTSGMSTQANTDLGAALHALQQSKPVRVALTLQVNTDLEAASGATGPGLDGQAQILVQEVAAAGAQIARVNLMVMSFGSSRPAGETEAQAAIEALGGAQAELKTLIPGLTDAQSWAMLGATAEIGQNDQNVGEIFTVADATTLATFAASHGMGLVSFWSIDRDRTCAGPCGFQKYSTVDTSDYQFTKAFMAVLR